VPGASIKVVDESTGTAEEAFTNGGGAYRVGPLRSGRYRVEASLSGFETAVQRVVLEAAHLQFFPIAKHGRLVERASCPSVFFVGLLAKCRVSADRLSNRFARPAELGTTDPAI
jgi:hypothetical protein